MKNLSKKLLGPVQIIILAGIIGATASYVYAVGYFQEPGAGCLPPSCNAEAPVNVSSSPQIKNGKLGVGGGGALTTGLEVFNGQILVDTGNVNVVTGNVNAGAFFYNSSDRSLKSNVSPLQDSLNKILQLQGVSFNWKRNGTPSVGLIAQDVEKVYPELVATDPKTGLKSLAYPNLVAPLIEAVKAQQLEIDQLKAEIQILQNHK